MQICDGLDDVDMEAVRQWLVVTGLWAGCVGGGGGGGLTSTESSPHPRPA